MTRRISRAIVAVVLAGAATTTMAGPVSAAPFGCDVAGLIQIDGDIPMAGTGPAAVAVGESNTYGIDVDLANVIPEEFSFLEGTANSAVVSVKIPSGVEIDASSATVTGVAGASFAIAGDAMTVTLPGPIAFGGDTRLPLVSVSFVMKATQEGTITLSTEGASAVVEAVAAIAPGTDPIPATATCTAGAPETLLSVTASEVASGSAAPPPVQTAATPTAATPDPAIATTGAESTTLAGIALLLVGFGMLAVAAQRLLPFRQT